MRTEAGPPVARTDPDPTNKPVPKAASQPRSFINRVLLLGRTDRTSNRNHLHMAPFKTTLQGSVARALPAIFDVKATSICVEGLLLALLEEVKLTYLQHSTAADLDQTLSEVAQVYQVAHKAPAAAQGLGKIKLRPPKRFLR